MDEVSKHPEEIENQPVEKGGVVGLVFLTIFVLTIIGGLVFLPFYAERDPMKEVLNSEAWWVPNVGEYHPLVLHLPIGIVFLTVVMELCSWLSFGRYRPMTGVALFLAFLTGAFACVTGLFDLKVEGMAHEDWGHDMFKHMWMGIVFVGVLGLALLAKIWGRRNGARGPVYGILLFVAAGVLAYGAHFGGVKTHKEDPLMNTLKGFELIKNEKESKDVERVSDTPEAGAEAEMKLPQDRLAFAEVVVPIMEQRCFSCHSEKDNHNKGELWMDSYENLLIGGELHDDDPERYATLVPGNAEKSYMIEVLNLPEDDELHMPPKKEEQMGAHEIELLTWWVATIPASEVLEDQTLAEMNAPQGILDAAAKLLSLGE